MSTQLLRTIFPPSKLSANKIRSMSRAGVTLLCQRKGSENIFRIEVNQTWQGEYVAVNTANGHPYFSNSVAEIREWVNLH